MKQEIKTKQAIKCKCGNGVFIIDKIEDYDNKNVLATLKCAKCGNKEVLKKFRGKEINIIKVSKSKDLKIMDSLKLKPKGLNTPKIVHNQLKVG